MAGSLVDLIVLLGVLNCIGFAIHLTFKNTEPYFTEGVIIQAMSVAFLLFLHITYFLFSLYGKKNENHMLRKMTAASIPSNVAFGIHGGLLYAAQRSADWSTKVSILGLCLAATGLAVVGSTDNDLLTKGKGTLSPAPALKTKHLVVSGMYSYSRNPMISGVVGLLLGTTFLFHSQTNAIFTASFVLVKTIWFMVSEEPDMEARFGDEYKMYKRHVPRWLPRTTPYVPKPVV